MRGAVAAGHPLTAETGARILAEGGNAVDACIAAGFASWVVESPLTGPGGGGFMLVHNARDKSTRLLDFFVAAPGLGGKPADRMEMEAVDIDFDRSSTQVFRIGSASCAVPGTVAGLAEAHRAYGSLPWRLLLEPAIDLARRGFEMTRPQAYLHAILDLILRHTEEGKRVYGKNGYRLLAGDRVVLPELGDTLEQLAQRGLDAFYRGELGQAIVRHLRETGGAITSRDLTEYRVIRRRPVRVRFKGHEFVSNPPPSSGGVLIAYALELLDRLMDDSPPGSAEAMALLVEAMREQNRARLGSFERDLYRGGLAKRLCEGPTVRAAVKRMREGLSSPAEAAAPGGTTHISVIDALGDAASLSSSCGSGSGVVVPGTGIHLNNMLGEFDLVPSRKEPKPGTRLTSMMAPSVVFRRGRPRLVVGSAGSVRLRGAIFQIVVNVIGHCLSVDAAIERPRVHLEEPHVHCEGGADAAEVDRLEGFGYDVVRWRRRNLYFGGASAVELRENGDLAAAGDPRRGGHGVVVA